MLKASKFYEHREYYSYIGLPEIISFNWLKYRPSLTYTHTHYLPKVVLSKPQEEVTIEEDEAWAALLAYCTKPPVDIAQQVIQDVQARREFGIKKYGRPVTPHNGRHALKDAYEEVLDLAVYIKQQLVEDGQTQPSIPGDVKK